MRNTTEQLKPVSYMSDIYSLSTSHYLENPEAKFSNKQLQIAGTSAETASAC